MGQIKIFSDNQSQETGKALDGLTTMTNVYRLFRTETVKSTTNGRMWN
jgi:hypothetical protein